MRFWTLSGEREKEEEEKEKEWKALGEQQYLNSRLVLHTSKKYSSVCVCVMQTTAVVAHRKPFVAKALKLVPTTASTASAAAAFIRQIELGRHTVYECTRHIATGLVPPPPICIVCSIAPHYSPSP